MHTIVYQLWLIFLGYFSVIVLGYALVAQWIERRRPKAGVGGSNPSQGTNKYSYEKIRSI